MFYRGIFKQMKEDNNLDIEELNFYEGYYASFYEEYLKRSNYDIDFYISQGLSAGSKVLELACGTGRVGIPLAKAGFDVTGVDISKDMLAVYKEKLDKEPRRIKKRIKLVNGDITNLELNEKFDLIIFPATTICLFNDEGIVKIFNMVKKHLCEDGKFVFDIADVNDDSYSNDCGQPFMTSWFKDDEYNIVWMQEFKFTDLSEIVLNVYGERIKGDKTIRNIGYTRKRIITKDIIDKAVKVSDLKLKRIIDSDIDIENESRIKFFILGI